MNTSVTGHEVVFEKLYVGNYRAVLRFAERRVDDAQVAKEITAEVFTIAWGRVKSGGAVELPWLFRTAANLISNHYRRESRRRESFRTLADSWQSTDEDGSDDRLALELALSSLGERERGVITLTYWEGLSATEIAEVMSLSTSAVWTIQSRARAQLRTAMSDESTGGGRHARR